MFPTPIQPEMWSRLRLNLFQEEDMANLEEGARVQLSDEWLTTHFFVPNPKRVGTVKAVTGLNGERRVVQWDGWRILPSYHERYLKEAK